MLNTLDKFRGVKDPWANDAQTEHEDRSDFQCKGNVYQQNVEKMHDSAETPENLEESLV